MAVSGSKDYAVTRTNIIEAAHRKIGIFDAGEAIDGPNNTASILALNLIVKELIVRGADIWLRDEITLFLQPDQKSYQLGATDKSTRTITGETTLSAAEVAAQTVISVTSSAGMTAADVVGIKMDDNTIHWSTIASVDSSIQITIDDATDDDAASGNKVYAYTTLAGRPTKIVSAYRRDINDIDTVIDMVGEEEYRSLSNKGSSGPPVLAWYQPTLTSGTLYVWPVDGGSSVDKLVLSAQYYPDDFDSATDNPQFPAEWYEALVYGLADRLAPELGIPLKERGFLRLEAKEKIEEALNFDTENASVIFALDDQR